MRIVQSMHPEWLSNTWLVSSESQEEAVLIDSGAPPEPILEAVAARNLEVKHVLCTHHHHDHVAHNPLYRERLGARIFGHPAEEKLFEAGLDQTLEDGDTLRVGDLTIRAVFIPGHTCGQLAYVINEERVFTGDTLFKGSVGGTRGPGHTTFEDIRASIMDRLMDLPREMPVHPGHMGETTIGSEWETNPFVRLWRGVDEPRERPCQALGRTATLVLRAPDYDGGTKCWVRFPDTGDDIVPGSRVTDPE